MMEKRNRQYADHLTLAFEMAEKLRKAGLSAEVDLSTRHEHMTKVRIHLGSTDCSHLCIYSGRWGPKCSPHEMRGPDLTAVIEACWNDRVDDARALLGYVDGAPAPGDEGVAEHAYIASHGPSPLSSYAIAVAAGDDFKGYVDGVKKADHLSTQAEGITRLLKRCGDRGIDRVAIHAGVEIFKLAAGISEPSTHALRKFVGAVQSGTVGIVWLPIDETSKGYRSALKRAKRLYEERWFEAA